MKALQVRRSIARLGLARVASALGPAAAAKVGPLEYRSVDVPDLPGDGWHRVRTRLSGICGSDLSMIEGHASTYFDDVVSFPFVPGHEVVGTLDDDTKVALEPVLGHAARGFSLPFPGAAPGDGDDYGHLTDDRVVERGIQTGFCCSTGGGWAPEFVAHDSQLHRLDAQTPDEQAVLIEPLAAGIHAALLAARGESAVNADAPIIAVLGAGTMGLAAIAGLVRYVSAARIVVGARYEHQQRAARALGTQHGADITVVPAAELARAVRRIDGCRMIGEALAGGAHAVIDAVGATASITDCLSVTRPRGRTVLMGMPAEVTLDLSGLWHRETELVGAYTYGTETLPDGSRRRTFELAIETAAAIEAERWVSATYRLADHVDAIAHAAAAGRRGAIKIAFDLRSL